MELYSKRMEFHVHILYSLCRKEFYAYLKYRVFEYQTRGLSCLDFGMEQGHQYSFSSVLPRGKGNTKKIFSVINITWVYSAFLALAWRLAFSRCVNISIPWSLSKTALEKWRHVRGRDGDGLPPHNTLPELWKSKK